MSPARPALAADRVATLELRRQAAARVGRRSFEKIRIGLKLNRSTTRATLPKPDHVLRGQPFWRAGCKPYVTRDGRSVVLVTWLTLCARCGERFFQNTVLGASKFAPTRRYTAHRRRGRRVKVFRFWPSDAEQGL